MKSVIITGATGFLGSQFVSLLLEKKTEVYAVVRNVDKLRAQFGDAVHLHAIELDLACISKLPELLNGSFDAFYHFAWNGTAGAAREDYAVQTQNVKAACAAVDAACRLGCKKFINAGSLMEFEAIKLMQTPGCRPAGNYIYRSAKLAAHYMAEAEAGRLGIPFVNMIISNVYGAGEESERFICSVLKKIHCKHKTCFTEGRQLYDFMYLTDAAEAMELVGDKGEAFKDYYIGSGVVKPLREYVLDIYTALELEETPVFGARAYDGISLRYDEFDKDILFRELGFCCKTDFREGIRKTYDWMENNESGLEDTKF